MATNVVFFLVRNNELTERVQSCFEAATRAFGTERMQFEGSFTYTDPHLLIVSVRLCALTGKKSF